MHNFKDDLKILLLRNSVYPYQYKDDWKKFNETSLPENPLKICSHSNMKDITDADCAHAKRVRNIFEIKNLGECHDLYVQSKTSF